MNILLLEQYPGKQEFRDTHSQDVNPTLEGMVSAKGTLQLQATVSETRRSEALYSDQPGHCAYHTCSVQILFGALLMLLR